MLSKSKIKMIPLDEARQMLDLLTDSNCPGENMPEGLFLWREGEKWIACDNLDGYAWVEEFAKRHDAEHWLLGW